MIGGTKRKKSKIKKFGPKPNMYVLSGAGGWPAEVGGTSADWRHRRHGGRYQQKGMKAGAAGLNEAPHRSEPNVYVLSGFERTGPPDIGPARVGGAADGDAWQTDRIGGFSGESESMATNLARSAQRRGRFGRPATRRLGSREQNREGGEGAHAACPKNRGYSDLARRHGCANRKR